MLKMECTGFGLNLVSGNFEFACLIVIGSEDFWHRFGGRIEASWESYALRQYSSPDGDSLAALPFDDAWSNEGLFAFLQRPATAPGTWRGPGGYPGDRVGVRR